jgi:hypothetical protein
MATVADVQPVFEEFVSAIARGDQFGHETAAQIA